MNRELKSDIAIKAMDEAKAVPARQARWEMPKRRAKKSAVCSMQLAASCTDIGERSKAAPARRARCRSGHSVSVDAAALPAHRICRRQD